MQILCDDLCLQPQVRTLIFGAGREFQQELYATGAVLLSKGSHAKFFAIIMGRNGRLKHMIDQDTHA